DRIAVPPGLRILGELPAVGPDDPPYFAKGVHEVHLLRRLHDLSRSQFVEIFAGHPLGIASYYRIVCVRRENGPKAIAWFTAVQRLLPQRSIRQAMFRPAVFRHGLRAKLADPAVARVPDS